MKEEFIKNENEETKIIPFEDENGNKIELELIDAFEIDSTGITAGEVCAIITERCKNL